MVVFVPAAGEEAVSAACRRDRISFSASRLDPPNRPACARCLITSVGTRTAHAAISPSEEATECVRMTWVRDGEWESEGVSGRNERLTPS